LTPQGRQKIEENKGNSASAKGGKGNAIQMLMLALFTAFSLCNQLNICLFVIFHL